MELLSSSLPRFKKCIVIFECQGIACGKLGGVEGRSLLRGDLPAG